MYECSHLTVTIVQHSVHVCVSVSVCVCVHVCVLCMLVLYMDVNVCVRVHVCEWKIT